MTCSPDQPSVRYGSVLHKNGGPGVMLHGGAWDVPYDESVPHLEGIGLAAGRGEELLKEGAHAVSCAAAAVSVMEDHPAFDAGRGSVLRANGRIEMDAGIMDGSLHSFGAVACVEGVRNPIELAKSILKGNRRQSLLVGDGAKAWARTHGLGEEDPAWFVTERERRRYQDLGGQSSYHSSDSFLESRKGPQGTVGCVVRDAEGRLAAATSTGGTPMSMPGRVGDTPLPGCGFYASETIALSSTGWGEAIAAVMLCREAAQRFDGGDSLEQAVTGALRLMWERVKAPSGKGATGGLIAITREGASWAYSTPRMSRAGWHSGSRPWTAM